MIGTVRFETVPSVRAFFTPDDDKSREFILAMNNMGTSFVIVAAYYFCVGKRGGANDGPLTLNVVAHQFPRMFIAP